MKENIQAKPTVDFTDDYPVFTPEMKATYTILIPDMLPWHFDLLVHVMRRMGYKVEVLHNEGRAVIDEGLKHVHNDTCYPALCVIMLSALGKETDKVRGLNAGADDYIAKPFGVLELVARVNAALRRSRKSGSVQKGSLILNTDTMTVTFRGKPLDLSNKEYQLLRYFMLHEGKVLARENILAEVWGYDGGETRTLDNYVARLRKMGLNFETVFGVGYKFIAD